MQISKTGNVEAEGTDVLVEKRYCEVTEIQVNHENVDVVKNGSEPDSAFLGKIVIPAVLFKLEIPIMFNKKHEFVYAILAGENNGFCNLKVVDPNDEGMNETKAILDMKTAAVQIFCKYTGLPVPSRDGGGSCNSCKHKRKAEVTEKDGEIVKHAVCGLDGLIVDKDWHKVKKFVEAKNTGLVGKKEKTTMTYEHSEESPYLSSYKGRYRDTANMKSRYTDEGVNCEFYAPWFHIAKEDKWVKRESRRLPWEENKVIGSEVIVDASEFIDRSEDEISKVLAKLDFNRKVLRKLANSGEDEEVLKETIKLLTENELDDEKIEMLLKEIMEIRK